MNTARIIVLMVALSAGGVAAYLARGSDAAPPPAAPVAQLPTADVLVAKSDIGLGQTVKPEDLQWQTWPAATASNGFIRRADKAEAIKEVAGSIARAPFIAGEPIRQQKKPEQSETLARARQSGTLSLALRSISNINMVENKSDDQAPKRGETVSVVRYGVSG